MLSSPLISHFKNFPIYKKIIFFVLPAGEKSWSHLYDCLIWLDEFLRSFNQDILYDRLVDCISKVEFKNNFYLLFLVINFKN